MTENTNNNAAAAMLAQSQKKSMAAAVILTFLFGPLGLLYVTVPGAILLIVVSIVLGIITLGLGFIVGWLASIIWAIIAVGKHNGKMNTIARS